MSRRVSRLRTEPPDRQPVLIVGALVIGLVVGLVMVPRLFSGMDSRAENYVLLASSLYAQGESPLVLRDRLVSVGVQQPASTVLGLAQRYAQSRDRKQQHDAEALEAFGKVLLNPDAVTPTPQPVATVALSVATAVPTTIAPPPLALGTRPAGTPGASPGPGTPTATPAVANAMLTPSATAQTTGTPGPGATPAAAVAAPPSTPGAVQHGRVKPAEGGSARLRKDPSQDGGTLAVIPFAAQVDILESVRGQAIDGESRWLRVRYGNLVGYLWSKLVVTGD